MKTTLYATLVLFLFGSLFAATPLLQQPLVEKLKQEIHRVQYLGVVGGVMEFGTESEAGGVLSPMIYTTPYGTCDDVDDCEVATKKACKSAGHTDKVKDVATTNDELCTATCDDGSGAVAFVFCDPAKTDGIVDEPDPTGVR